MLNEEKEEIEKYKEKMERMCEENKDKITIVTDMVTTNYDKEGWKYIRELQKNKKEERLMRDIKSEIKRINEEEK